MRILAIDDDPVFLELLSLTLGKYDLLETETVSSPKLALDILEFGNWEFDLIFCDILMPGINGIEMARRIRRTPHYQSTPIVMLTAASRHEYLEDAFLAGATDFVTKPIVEDELLGRVVALASHAIQGSSPPGQSTAPKDWTKILDENWQAVME